MLVDLKKAYYLLDRVRAMQILEGYGVGANIRHIISLIWQGDTLVPRQAGYYGKALFKAKRGVHVGDVMSPTVFNIVVDALVRHWKHTHSPVEFEELALFYADDEFHVGDVMSPTVFNIVVDVVVRYWKHTHSPLEFEELALFYADDGMITGTGHARVQASLDAITSSFGTVGLKMNTRKTQFMVMTGGRHRLQM